MLWHIRLGHISNQCIQRLVSEGILDPFDLLNFQVRIECIKGKQTNVRKKDANRCGDVLEWIHTDVHQIYLFENNEKQRYSTYHLIDADES